MLLDFLLLASYAHYWICELFFWSGFMLCWLAIKLTNILTIFVLGRWLWQVKTSQWCYGVFMIISQHWLLTQCLQSLLGLVAPMQNMHLRLVQVMINLRRSLVLGHEVPIKGMMILLKMFNSAHQGSSSNHNQLPLDKVQSS